MIFLCTEEKFVVVLSSLARILNQENGLLVYKLEDFFCKYFLEEVHTNEQSKIILRR